MPDRATLPLHHLSRDTVSHLRSTINITCLADALTELIQNALDADASQIDCWINIDSWSLRVSDDGTGIGREGMKTIGQRYASSKASDAPSLSKLDTYGFRGEALASLAATSLLTITSRHTSEAATYHKIIKGGEVLSNGTTKRLARFSNGMVVDVRDLFYNVPVRRPAHLAVQAASPFLDQQHPDQASTLSACRKAVELAALAVRSRGSRSLSASDSTHTKGARTTCSGVGYTLSLESDNPGKERCRRLMTIPKLDSSLDAFKSIFGRALVQQHDVQEVHASAKGGEMRIDGFVSFCGHISKAHQYIFVNGFSLKRCDLHKTVEQRFARSSFGRHQSEDQGEEDPAYRIRQSPRRLDLKPVYVLHITIAPAKVDLTIEPRKRTLGFDSWTTVERFLSSVTDYMLARHGFMEERTVQARIATASPISAMAPRPRTPSSIAKRSRSDTVQDQTSPSRVSVTSRQRSRAALISDLGAGTLGEGSVIVQDQEDTNVGQTAKDSTWSEWLEATLAKSRASVAVESRIPAVDLANPEKATSGMIAGGNRLNLCMQHDADTLDTQEATQAFAKTDLRDAVVLGQVDQKFICCLINRKAKGSERLQTIILVDQHAADERIRVEAFRQDIARELLADGVEVTDIGEDPHLILLSKHNVDWLRGSSHRVDLLRRWGFVVNLPENDPSAQEKDYEQIQVGTVPKLLDKRLGTQSSKEVKKILQGFISTHEAEGIGGILSLISNSDSTSVSSVLRWCPTRMIELINSKACRGAIMFNDPLTPERCEKLVRDLALTDFPFMCAHGRPSMIPLVTYGRAAHADKRGIDWSRIRL